MYVWVRSVAWNVSEIKEREYWVTIDGQAWCWRACRCGYRRVNIFCRDCNFSIANSAHPINFHVHVTRGAQRDKEVVYLQRGRQGGIINGDARWCGRNIGIIREGEG